MRLMPGLRTCWMTECGPGPPDVPSILKTNQSPN